jgi:hypothetical protein
MGDAAGAGDQDGQHPEAVGEDVRFGSMPAMPSWRIAGES